MTTDRFNEGVLVGIALGVLAAAAVGLSQNYQASIFVCRAAHAARAIGESTGIERQDSNPAAQLASATPFLGHTAEEVATRF